MGGPSKFASRVQHRNTIARPAVLRLLVLALAGSVVCVDCMPVPCRGADLTLETQHHTEVHQQGTVLLNNGSLSPRGAAVLIEHLLALFNKECDDYNPARANADKRAKITRDQMPSYREGLIREWYLQISLAGDVFQIDRSATPPRISYNRRYVRVSAGIHQSTYFVGQADGRELVDAWLDAIECEVERNKEAILSRSGVDEIDYSALPQLEALRYLRRRLRAGGFGGIGLNF